MSANVESMFYVREKPWHGLGTMVQEAPTSADALHLAGLDWVVEPRQMYVETESVFGSGFVNVPGFVANTRSSDNKILGVVTDKYQIVQNADAFAFTDNLIGDEVRYETAGSLNDGKRTWLLARLPETEIVGDKTEQYLVFTNTFDGSGSVRVACTPVRVVCQNTLNFALGTAKRAWSFRHTSNIDDRLQEAHDALQLAGKYINALKKDAEFLATQHLSDREIDGLVNQLFPIALDATPIMQKNTERQRATFRTALNADDLRNFFGTKWQFVNAAVDMADHAQPLRMTENSRETRLGNVFNGHALVDKAYELVYAM